MITDTHPYVEPALKAEGDPLDWPLYERPLIYVAGYYSANPAHGLQSAVCAAEELLNVGWLPLVPHVSFMWDAVSPHIPDFWYAYDLGLLMRCDAMYVCGGPLTNESHGVKEEIRFATQYGIPIFYDVVPAKERYDE